MLPNDLAIGSESEYGACTLLVDHAYDSERGFARGPVRALMAALLFDGIVAYMNYECFPSAKSRERYKEAVQWVHSEEREYVFSFDNVCEGLGINSEHLRLGLINAVNSKGGEWKKARRNF